MALFVLAVDESRYYLLARSIQSDERAQDDRDKIKIHLIVPQRYAKCDDYNLI